MPFIDDKEAAEAQKRHVARRDRYAGTAAEKLVEAEECQFSLLPFAELQQAAAHWYDACSEGMMRANYAPIDILILQQARVAAEQGFELNDLLLFLRLCRQVAIQEERWNEEQLVEIDTVIDEALAHLRGQIEWDIPEGLNYLTGRTLADLERERQAGVKEADRRGAGRNRLHLPIRVRGILPKGPVNEITRTENVARGGVYFFTENAYYQGLQLHVTYPFWDAPDAINESYPAEVVRIDEVDENRRGVALHFLIDLGKRRPYH